MQEIIFQNATVFTGTDVLSGASVRLADGRIQEVSAGSLTGPTVMDLGGQWLLPGLIDLQLYGGSALFMNESPTAETVAHVYQTHLKNGTTSVLPTLYSASHEVILRAIEAVRAVRQTAPMGVLGLHVEGPYMNPIKRGAHSLNYVRKPSDQELAELVAVGKEVIGMMTLAPECFSEEQLTWIMGSGLRLSVGHTNATYQQATSYFNAGIPLATHLYNAMRPFESREPGVVGAIFDHPTVKVSLIADGFHCDWASIRIAKRQLNREGAEDRLFLISDAVLANPPRDQFAHEDFIIHYENGRYITQEGKLAGSSITLLDAVRNCIQHVGFEPAEVVRMASTLPAEIMGLGEQLGKIRPGHVANLIVLDPALNLQQVFVNGQSIPRE